MVFATMRRFTVLIWLTLILGCGDAPDPSKLSEADLGPSDPQAADQQDVGAKSRKKGPSPVKPAAAY